jgi:hypothetical protein
MEFLPSGISLLNVLICIGPFIAFLVTSFYLVNWLVAYRAARIEKVATPGGILQEVSETIQCWVINNCPPEQRDNCIAYQNQDTPCWQHFRSEGGGPLMANCLGCKVFQNAPMRELPV